MDKLYSILYNFLYNFQNFFLSCLVRHKYTSIIYTCLQKNLYTMFQMLNLLGIGLRTSGMRISTKAWYITWSQLHIHFRIDSFLHRVISFALGSRLSISLRLLVLQKCSKLINHNAFMATRGMVQQLTGQC